MKIDIDKFKKSRIDNEITGIISSLEKINKESINVIPEEMFVQGFLPLFLGEVPEDVNLLQTWFGIAGNPYMPVNVAGKNGEILYTVPAFFEREAINLNGASDDAVSIMSIVATTEQLTNMHPKRAERYFQEQMNRRNIVKDNNPLTAKNLKVWTDICQRYNKQLPAYMVQSQPSKEVESKNTEMPNQDKGGLEYGSDVF